MRFHRSLLACLVLTASTTSASEQPADAEQEPQFGPVVVIGVDSSAPGTPGLLPDEAELGPIVPIGNVISDGNSGNRHYDGDADGMGFDRRNLVSPTGHSEEDMVVRFPDDRDSRFSEDGTASTRPPLYFVSERQYAAPFEDPANRGTGFYPIRVIGQPMPAPTGEPLAFGIAPVLEPVHPDQIQFHLSAVTAQLAMAGLSIEAQKIFEFQQEFQYKHSQRLLIAYKEAQVRALQAEIASLKQGQSAVASDHPAEALPMKFIFTPEPPATNPPNAPVFRSAGIEVTR